MVIPPELVTTVCGGEVNDAYLDYVVLLKTRLEYAQEVQQSGGLAQTAAGQELLPDLERLRVRAVSKVYCAPVYVPFRLPISFSRHRLASVLRRVAGDEKSALLFPTPPCP